MKQILTFERKKFFKSFFLLVLPITLQALITALVGTADIIMTGYINQASLSAVSLASQVQFFLNLFYSGLTIGVSMLTAQYWGKKDVRSIENVLGIALKVVFPISLIFGFFAAFFPSLLMRIFTTDPEFIRIGSEYLRIIAVTYLFMGISQVYISSIRSTERVVISSAITAVPLVINIFLNAVFIFGLFGAPKLGVIGIAISTVIARFIELMFCCGDLFLNKKIHYQIKRVFKNNLVIIKDYIHYTLPILGNSLVWGGAVTTYSIILGHLDGDAVAANSIAVVLQNLVTVIGTGIAGGCAVILGKSLGENNLDKARHDSRRILFCALVMGIAAGIVILSFKPLILKLVPLSQTALPYLEGMIYISSYYVIGKTMNGVFINGIFCSGGDTKFGLIEDTLVMWCFVIPFGCLAAFVFKWPVVIIFFILYFDELFKMPINYIRYLQYKWLNNLTHEINMK